MSHLDGIRRQRLAILEAFDADRWVPEAEIIEKTGMNVDECRRVMGQGWWIKTKRKRGYSYRLVEDGIRYRENLRGEPWTTKKS